MSTNFRINDTSKWGMLTLALLFDGIQFVTPDIMDKMIIAFAFFTFGMWFLEKGALTWKAPTNRMAILRMVKLLGPIVEIFISNAPTITLVIAAHIATSRAWDIILGEKGVEFVGLLRLPKDVREIRGHRKVYRHQKDQLKKYAYGKGKRGARALAKRVRGQRDVLTNKPGKTTEQARRRLSSAKLTQ